MSVAADRIEIKENLSMLLSKTSCFAELLALSSTAKKDDKKLALTVYCQAVQTIIDKLAPKANQEAVLDALKAIIGLTSVLKEDKRIQSDWDQSIESSRKRSASLGKVLDYLPKSTSNTRTIVETLEQSLQAAYANTVNNDPLRPSLSSMSL